MPDSPFDDDSNVSNKVDGALPKEPGTLRLNEYAVRDKFDDVTQLEAAARRGAWPDGSRHLGHAYPSQQESDAKPSQPQIAPEALLPLVQLEIARDRGGSGGRSLVPWKLISFAVIVTGLLLGSVFFIRSMQAAVREVGQAATGGAVEHPGLIARMTKRMLAAILPPSDLGAPEKINVTTAPGPAKPKELPPPLEFKPVAKKDNAARPAGLGSVEIHTVPNDAEVYLNGLLLGNHSPAIATHKSTQDVYSFSVKRRGYLEHTAIFTLEPNERKVFTVELKRTAKR